MQVSYWSKKSRNDKYLYQDLPVLLSSCDILVYALAKNNETDSLLSDTLLENLNPKSLFVSIAHIDHQKFVSFVNDEKLAGYACDDRI